MELKLAVCDTYVIALPLLGEVRWARVYSTRTIIIVERLCVRSRGGPTVPSGQNLLVVVNYISRYWRRRQHHTGHDMNLLVHVGDLSEHGVEMDLKVTQ